MSISYPLAFPTVGNIRRIAQRGRSATPMSMSPFSLAQQVFAHQGDLWSLTVEFTEMDRADAEAWIAWRLSLNHREGTFLFNDPKHPTPRGTWYGASPSTFPVVHGAHAAGVKTLTIRGVDGLTWKAGDRFQVGSGSTSRLHMVAQDGQQTGSPSTGTVEFWPRLRESLSDGAAITLLSPKGLFRLADNESEWGFEAEDDHVLSPLNIMEALG